MKLEDLKVKIFADGADIETIRGLAANPLIAGFTTNPSVCRKAGVKDFEAFAKEAVKIVAPRPISFEVFADELDEMERQARIIAGWGDNIYVKLPVTNTHGVSVGPIVGKLLKDGIKVNVTAITTTEQITELWPFMHKTTPHYLSIFAGRIADTGVSPKKIIGQALAFSRHMRSREIIWASPREVWNVYQADRIGCHIITATPDILAKLSLCGKDLTEYSLETVRMFFDDALVAGYAIA